MVKSKSVVLATGQDFPDALCAAPLAKKLGAPILLNVKSKLLSEVEQEYMV
ncbi:cell wall-binding repeat-containing protein [Clostridium sp.]